MKSESAGPRVLLDTKPLIELFAKEEGWQAVQKIASRIEAGEIDAGVSVVTLTEVYYKYLQEGRADLAKTRTQELRYSTYLTKLEVNEDVAVKAGEFKGKYEIPIADALIAASAYLASSTIITDDPDFKLIREIKTVTENEFISNPSP